MVPYYYVITQPHPKHRHPGNIYWKIIPTCVFKDYFHATVRHHDPNFGKQMISAPRPVATALGQCSLQWGHLRLVCVCVCVWESVCVCMCSMCVQCVHVCSVRVCSMCVNVYSMHVCSVCVYAYLCFPHTTEHGCLSRCRCRKQHCEMQGEASQWVEQQGHGRAHGCRWGSTMGPWVAHLGQGWHLVEMAEMESVLRDSWRCCPHALCQPTGRQPSAQFWNWVYGFISHPAWLFPKRAQTGSITGQCWCWGGWWLFRVRSS